MTQPLPHSSSLSRRSVLRSGIMAFFGLYGLGPSLAKSALHPPAPLPPTAIDPLTAIILAKTALDVVQGFSKKPDGLVTLPGISTSQS